MKSDYKANFEKNVDFVIINSQTQLSSLDKSNSNNNLKILSNLDKKQDLKKKNNELKFISDEKIKTAESIMGYVFQNKSILEEAFTHPSLKRINNNIRHYQRLEFLGDKILGLIIAEYLFKTLKDQDEGVLSKKQALLVSGNICYQIALDLGLDEFLIMSNSQDKDGGRNNKKILQNITESVIGAIYIDSGDINIAKNFILKVWKNNLTLSQKDLDLKDPKTTLQEWYQQSTKSVPDYKTETFLNGNTNYFEVSLVIKDIGEVRVVDTNRKIATKLVAAKMLKLLQDKGKL